MPRRLVLLASLLVFARLSASLRAQSLVDAPFARDPAQKIDNEYTQKITQYTTAPALNSPLTNYLPASQTVPTPAKVLGDVAGAPDMLPYAEDVYRYFRDLAAATPRVQVFTIGHTEEGREMIAAAVADQSLLARLKENDARLAKLADPRIIQLNDSTAHALAAQSFPVYYITGTIHSPETGAPTALMELAYRLAVDDSPYIKYIRSHMVVLITPVVEVDGRDRMVDIYKWHKAHPGDNWPRLIYWGHYVAHDNNRDAMAMTLALTRNVLDTYLHWHAQVLHDLHESVPFLYDNTVGDGPYNAWIDPLLSDEWAALGWNNVAQLQSFGMPGAFTHGNFDTWSPGYLMFLAAMHNGISRLYETFGNGGADTEKRILSPDQYSRTWYRPNPPYPTVLWSQRDNNNYEETALLTTLSYFAHNSEHFLENYYLKSKRSVAKPESSGPVAYVLEHDEAFANRQSQLLAVLASQGVEIQQLTQAATVHLPAPSTKSAADDKAKTPASPQTRTLPAGSAVIRMDQPYSRAADALLDRQFWAPDDPQKHPYDDTGWSFGDLFHAKVLRVTDAALLNAPMVKYSEPPATQPGDGPVYVVDNSGQTTLISLVYALKCCDLSIATDKFTAAGKQFHPGSLIIARADAARVRGASESLHLNLVSLSAKPSVAMRPAAAPRIAFMHTWLYTQTEGWWRQAFDQTHVPYAYISTQTVAAESDLNSKYDAIVFAPVAHVSAAQILDGLPLWGNPIPWQKTPLTPNLGNTDETPDMRPGLGPDGLAHLRSFVERGGLLITAEDAAEFAIQTGLAPGVFVAPPKEVRVVGSVLRASLVDAQSPIAYGYDSDFAVYSQDGLAFTIGDMTVNRTLLTEKQYKRPTGRGGPDDDDSPEDRTLHAPDPLPSPKPWQATPLNEEQARNNPYVIPQALRPDVVLRFGDAKGLLLSGLLEGGDAIASHPVVVTAHLGKGSVLLFAINPIYRGETIGSYALVFNALMNSNALAHAN